MNISSTQLNRPNHIAPRVSHAGKTASEHNPSVSSDTFSPSSNSVGETLAMVGLAGGMGAVGIGGPAALTMGAVKSFMNGNILLGVGLGAAAAATIPTVGLTSLGLAVMTSDGGDSTGLKLFGAGAALATAGAAWAIFA